MCCFFTALLLAGPRLAVLVWWIIRPLYVTAAFGDSWIWAILALIFLPWTTLMYLVIFPGGIVGFDWIILGLGIFADMAGYFGGYRNKERVPYGDQIP